MTYFFLCVILFGAFISTELSDGNPASQLIDSNCSPTSASTEVSVDYENCANQVKAANGTRNPDQDKTTGQIITSYGYSLQVHNVTTKDGYILTLHRINGSQTCPPRPGKHSVYVHHGMGGASDNWLFQYRDRNLAFLLADQCYDVWLANCRGTTYSLGHKTLNWKTDLKYWDFSWHEIAMYDIPATMNKISDVTGSQKMFYIGFSMGTTVYFISMSEMPDLNNRINSAFLLAPVAYDGHLNSPLRLIFDIMTTPEEYFTINALLGGRIDEAQKMEQLMNQTLGDYCVSTAVNCGICSNVMFALFGVDAPQMNFTNLPNIFSKFPNIISVKTLAHYAQSMATCDFRQFDYGLVGNLIIYGNPSPPAYDISRITAKTYFFHSDSDNLADTQDVEMARAIMKLDEENSFRVGLNSFNHLDFQIAIDADKLVYNKVLDLMNNYFNVAS